MTVEPMTDAELAEVRQQHDKWGLSTNPTSNIVFDRLFARLDAERSRADTAEAERDAAVARAMPEPVTMATLHDVLAMPKGNYLTIVGKYTYTLEREPCEGGRWYSAHFGEYLVDAEMVGHTVCGPLPDLPTPTAAQEATDAP